MKEETFKEYHWHNEEVIELLRKEGVKGVVINFYASDDHGLYLSVKTRTNEEEK